MRFSVAATAVFAASVAATNINLGIQLNGLNKPGQDGEDWDETNTAAPVETPTETPCETETPSVTPSVSASASPSPSGPAVTTEVITSFTTYCPAATTLTHGTNTYTITAPTTFTYPGSVTVTRPIHSSTVTVCNYDNCPASTGTSLPSPSVSPVYPNNTAVITSAQPSPSAPAPYEAGASRVVGAGAGLAGLLAMAVYLL